MNGTIRTKHFNQRIQQRGLDETVVMALFHCGERRTSHRGIDSLIFTKNALADIRSDHGLAIFKACERLRSAYLITSEDGVLITVAHSYRRTIHRVVR